MNLKKQNWKYNPEARPQREESQGESAVNASGGTEAGWGDLEKQRPEMQQPGGDLELQNQGLKKPVRMKKRKLFVRVNKAQTKIVTLGLVLQYAPNEDGQIRVGFTTTKRLGHAVVRNRIRRRLREVVRLTPEVGDLTGYDLVIVGRTATATRAFSKLKGDFAYALRQIRKGVATESVGEANPKTEEAECCDACV